MIPFVYILLLIMMLYMMCIAGNRLKRGGGVFSYAGILAILTYTFNEGLRFGRNIDYNVYGDLYEQLAKGQDSNKGFVFERLNIMMSDLGLPYQVLVILESFLFIIGSLILLRHYRNVLPIALPLFVLFSMIDVENMIRWYIGLSFVFVGLSFLLSKKKLFFFFFCSIGCLFHIGLIPLCALLFLLFHFKRVIMPPYLSIPLYLGIGFLFQTEMMLNLTNIVNMFSFVSAAEGYLDNSDYWLTGGNSGRFRAAFPGISLVLFWLFTIWYGYVVYKKEVGKNHNYVFSYNLFLIGILFMPLAMQIELLSRYIAPLYFFRAIVCAYIIYDVFVYKIIRNSLFPCLFILLLLYQCFTYFKAPFVSNPKLFMYVWDRENETYDDMKFIWADESDKAASELEKKYK